MDTPLLLIAAILGLAAVYVVPAIMLEVYSRYCGARELDCPNTRRAATIRMDARHAALTAVLGRPKVNVVDCSLWPERRSCDQGCRKQV